MKELSSINNARWMNVYLHNLHHLEDSYLSLNDKKKLSNTRLEKVKLFETLYGIDLIKIPKDEIIFYVNSLNRLGISFKENNQVSDAISLFEKTYNIIISSLNDIPSLEECFYTSYSYLIELFNKNDIEERDIFRQGAIKNLQLLYSKNPAKWRNMYTIELSYVVNNLLHQDKLNLALDYQKIISEIYSSWYSDNPITSLAKDYLESLDKFYDLTQKSQSNYRQTKQLHEKIIELSELVILDKHKDPPAASEFLGELMTEVLTIREKTYKKEMLTSFRTYIYHVFKLSGLFSDVGENKKSFQVLKNSLLYLEKNHLNNRFGTYAYIKLLVEMFAFCKYFNLWSQANSYMDKFISNIDLEYLKKDIHLIQLYFEEMKIFVYCFETNDDLNTAINL